MRVIYVCLSPTFGMHQYTADLANRMAGRGWEVGVVATSHSPCDRYSPSIRLVTPVSNRSTGFSSEGLRLDRFRKVCYTIEAYSPDIVHFTAPHLWTPWLLRFLAGAQAGDGGPVATIHTLHDLDPHTGRRFGPLIRTWNRLVVHRAGHLLVHGRSYHARLLAEGLPPHRLSYTPLLHLCFSASVEHELNQAEFDEGTSRPAPSYAPAFAGSAAAVARHGDAQPALGLSPSTTLATHLPSDREAAGLARQPSTSPSPSFSAPSQPFALFFGRIEVYKGVGVLMDAAARMSASDGGVVVAGPGALAATWTGPLPPQVELRNRLIEDAEALDLFRACSLVVLPYLDATQSALPAVAYYFGKPVVVTRSGALPEYVQEGVTGWVIPPNDPAALAACLSGAMAAPERLAVMGAAGRAWRRQQRAAEMATLTQMYETAAALA